MCTFYKGDMFTITKGPYFGILIHLYMLNIVAFLASDLCPCKVVNGYGLLFTFTIFLGSCGDKCCILQILWDMNFL
jgi:hypothetical protein